jgi:hypothetical protein
MEDVASVAHAAIVMRDWDALHPLLHPYLHWVQADGQVVRGRTKVIGMLQAVGISGPPASVELRDGQVYRWYVSGCSDSRSWIPSERQRRHLH